LIVAVREENFRMACHTFFSLRDPDVKSATETVQFNAVGKQCGRHHAPPGCSSLLLTILTMTNPRHSRLRQI
jgi:hypothetical protein